MRDWLRNWRTDTTVTCISCGVNVDEDNAREYDKEGDRWDRDGKTFEHMCKECYRTYKHAPRNDVRDRAKQAAEEAATQEEFVRAYVRNWPTAESDEQD